jgi:lysophospholipase L1-like esterase
MSRLSLRALLVATSTLALVAGTGIAAMAAPTQATVSAQANISARGPLTLSTASAPSQGSTAASPSASRTQWFGTWEGAPSGVDPFFQCQNCTIRNVVHTSIGGREVRIRVSNVFGTAPLQVAQATVALPATPGSADVAPGTLREVTFGGAASVTIPAGRAVLSDPVRLAVPANHDLLVTTYTPGDPTPFTYHPSAQQFSFYASGADQADATSASAFPQTTGSWYLLTGVEVSGTAARGDVVAFGDSITDGFQSTFNADARWPNILADRLLALPARDQMGVLDAGIGGNRILLDGGNGFGPAALSRFQRDVLDQSGVRTVIILEGINDIQLLPHQLDPNAIIGGLQKLIGMARGHGLRVIGATLTPFQGSGFYSPQVQQIVNAVNHWILTSHAYDAVVNFNAVVRDPADPHRFLPAFDSGDHLHPNDAGYMAMGAAVRLTELGADVPPGQAGPVVRSVAPGTARPGQVVTIRGSGFGATQGAGYVSFSSMGTYWGSPGSAAAFHVDSWSDRSITFTVPVPSGAGGVWHVSAGSTATINVVDAAGALSRTALLNIPPTASLSDYFDNIGISNDSSPGSGNIDVLHNSYSYQALSAAGITPGGTITSGGLSYTWPDAAAGAPDNVLAAGQTVLLAPTAGATTLGILGSATWGPSQGTATITYTDGSTQTFTLGFSDWTLAGGLLPGDTEVAHMPYRNSPAGASNFATYLFTATVALQAGKTAQSITLPATLNQGWPAAIHVFAITTRSAA